MIIDMLGVGVLMPMPKPIAVVDESWHEQVHCVTHATQQDRTPVTDRIDESETDAVESCNVTDALEMEADEPALVVQDELVSMCMLGAWKVTELLESDIDEATKLLDTHVCQMEPF